MDTTKILDLENDGLNMVADEQFLYVRCKRVMHKYNLIDMSLTAQNAIFKKDGKARHFSIYAMGKRRLWILKHGQLINLI